MTAEEDDEDDEPAPARGELFGTETMAELCVRQGRLPDALGIYRSLLAAGGSDEARRLRWEQRLHALQHPDAAATAALPGAQISLPAPVVSSPSGGARAPAASDVAASANANESAMAAPGARRSAAASPRGRIHVLPLVIREPVRAGQIVYAEKNDLIVLGPVNPGAQLMADGNIHVYGRLRGRAVAGAHGAVEARIYCQRLEAELVGIDSAYLIADDIPAERFGLPAQVYLRDGRCHVIAL